LALAVLCCDWHQIPMTTRRKAGLPTYLREICGLDVQARGSHNKAACALANKLARICYATFRDKEPFDEPTVRLAKKISRESFVFTPHVIDVDNSCGSLAAVRSDWCFGDADSMSARDIHDPTLDAGYTTACASPKAKISISLLRLWGSPYTRG
jgi:hypothetical protein